MTDTLTYYAASTGALRGGLSQIDALLRIALKTQRTEIGLRREIVAVLANVEEMRAEQHQRDVEAGNVPATEAA